MPVNIPIWENTVPKSILIVFTSVLAILGYVVSDFIYFATPNVAFSQ